MALSDLVRWNRKQCSLGVQERDSERQRSEMGPLVRLQQEINRLFDVFHSFAMGQCGPAQAPMPGRQLSPRVALSASAVMSARCMQCLHSMPT